MKSIVLCGFMGCGKSTVGKVLARRMGFDFVDMDSYIERREGMSVAEIFAAKGEKYFRSVESAVCAELSRRLNTVIAAGGGALVSHKNACILKGSCIIILLEAPFALLVQRIRKSTSRPLAVSSSDEQLLSLYQKRLPVYRNAADFSLEATGTPEDIAHQILERIEPE